MNPALERDDESARVRPPGWVGRSLILKLDLCRGFFAFFVVVAHGIDVCYVIHPEEVSAVPQSIRYLISYTIQSGIYWVMGFFVISGYCIQLSAGRIQGDTRFPILAYLAARATRIMPLYYLGLLFALVVELAVSSFRPSYLPNGVNHMGWLSQLFFLQRPFETFGSYAATWSISYEFFYYGLFGLLAMVVDRRRPVPAWLGMALCAGMGGSMLWLYTHGYRNWYTLQIGLFFGLGVNWFLGALAAVHGPSLVRSHPMRIIAVCWPLVFALAVALRGQGACPLQGIYPILGVAFTLMILHFQAVADRESESPTIPGWLSKAAEVVGLASYPTYLFHGPILLLLAALIARWDLISDWRSTWALLSIVGIGSGIALGWLVERPIMAWRAALLKRIKEPSIVRPLVIGSPILEGPR